MGRLSIYVSHDRFGDQYGLVDRAVLMLGQESMRMFPVGAMGTLRTSKQPLRVGGFTMPPDTPFILHFYAMFNSPTYWDQPEVFSPVSGVRSFGRLPSNAKQHSGVNSHGLCRA